MPDLLYTHISKTGVVLSTVFDFYLSVGDSIKTEL